MKKEILIVLSVVLIVVIVVCGLWLGWYAVDSQHQKQTYETLAEDFLLEETSPQPVLGGGRFPPGSARPPRKHPLLRPPRRPATTWRPCKVKIPTAWLAYHPGHAGGLSRYDHP